MGAGVCIKPSPARKEGPAYDRELDRRPNPIGRFFGRVKRCRRIATRHEKKPNDDAGFFWLAAMSTDLL